mgnify:CR=1 FL=1
MISKRLYLTTNKTFQWKCQHDIDGVNKSSYVNQCIPMTIVFQKITFYLCQNKTEDKLLLIGKKKFSFGKQIPSVC